jgi:hypothetical protein
MHDIFARDPDPLENILRPPSSPANEAVRQEVYAQTRRILRRRHRLRQLVYAAALAASFAAGLLIMGLTFSGERGRISAPSAQAPSEQAPSAQTSPPQSKDFEALPQPRSQETDALAMEWDAFDSTEHRGELYQQAGDRYMTEESDPQSALRCYSNALDNATTEDLAISTNDNWLLMVIKDARQKENNHAKQGG